MNNLQVGRAGNQSCGSNRSGACWERTVESSGNVRFDGIVKWLSPRHVFTWRELGL